MRYGNEHESQLDDEFTDEQLIAMVMKQKEKFIELYGAENESSTDEE